MLRLTLAYMAGFGTCLAIGVVWYLLHLKPQLEALKQLAEARLKPATDLLQGTF